MFTRYQVKLNSTGKRLFGTRKTKMWVVEVDAPIELSGGYWDGGSRDEYRGQTKTGSIIPLNYPTSPREYGGGNPPSVMPTQDMAIVKSGTFCGKDATVTAYVLNKDGWIHGDIISA